MEPTPSLFTVLDSVPNAIFLKNADLRFIFINKAYERLFGVCKEDVLWKNVLDLSYLPEKDREFYQREDQEMLRRGQTSHHIFHYRFSDGEMHTCLYWSGGFSQADGVRGLIGIIVDITSQSETIATLQDELKQVSTAKKIAEERGARDALTGLYNRGALEEALRTQAKERSLFSCVMFDIDHFKRVNDTFGHLEGDEVLKKVARIIKENSRGNDLACRYGGEEFLLILVGNGLRDAIFVAERIRVHVAETILLPNGEHITISAGCGVYKSGEAAHIVLQRADQALYEAKASGRNKVCDETMCIIART
ncbi:MAG: GGDEF domain-containing protein [Desulfobulbaceae bacterium]|jgi:diguanylate cyclase (GGDEF)-like protein/PAS domain S-box-containing protein|nr:GGDEF domain-containing protein [Desulfobulbaceae bacterium]